MGEPVPLGNTGITVARSGLGAAPLGNVMGPITDADAAQVMAAVLTIGQVLVDTAPFYGMGLSETRVGAGLAATGPGAVLSTKVGRLIRDGGYVEDYSYDGAMRSFEESLARLGGRSIDIAHVHDPDDHFDAAMAGAFKALRSLKDQGVIRAVSAGMNQWRMLSRFIDEGVVDCVLLAGRYTLLDRSAEATFLPKVQAAGVGLIIGGVFNSGLLADPRQNTSFNYVPASRDVLKRALQMQMTCAEHGVSLRDAALQFPMRHVAVSTVIVGVKSAQEWADNLASLDRPIPDTLWPALDALALPSD